MRSIQTDPVLERLQARFDAHRASMVAEHAGQWALLIEGDPQPQFFATDIEASAAGYAYRPPARFLVKQVLTEDRPTFIPYLVIAD